MEGLPNDLRPPQVVSGEEAIGSEHQPGRVQEVLASLVKGGSLGVCAREFLDKGDVPTQDGLEDRSELG